MITSEHMKRIINAFGPCSSTYECCEPAEMLQSFLEMKSDGLILSFLEFINVQLDVESIHIDRLADAYIEGGRNWNNNDADQFLDEMKQRVLAVIEEIERE